MTDEVAVQLVNVRTSKIVKLLALKAKYLMTSENADMDALAVKYVAIHKRPPTGRPQRKAALYVLR
jgi:hypothetical protein